MSELIERNLEKRRIREEGQISRVIFPEESFSSFFFHFFHLASFL